MSKYKMALGLIASAIMVLSLGTAQPASGVTESAPRATTATSDPAYYVVAKTRNKCGYREYLRRGNGRFGYRKIAIKHNLKKIAVWKAVIHKTCGAQDGQSTTYVYRRLIKRITCTQAGCSETARVWVRAVQQRSNNKGTITAYCEGRTKCPNWVNTLRLVENPARAVAPAAASYIMVA